MPLGVFALAQEEKGDPVMFFQISVNRDGIISGAYSNVLSDDQQSIAGQVDKATQRVAWRIGENQDTIFETTVGNLTLDVAPIAIHFGKAQTQTWLLVRMPQPAARGPAAKTPPGFEDSAAAQTRQGKIAETTARPGTMRLTLGGDESLHSS